MLNSISPIFSLLQRLSVCRVTYLLPRGTFSKESGGAEAVARFGGRRVSAGPRAYEKIASAGLSNIDIVDIAGPHLRALADDIGEIVHLARRDGFNVVYLLRATSSRPGRMAELGSRVGVPCPLHCTSMGKIFLAHMNDADALAFLTEPHEAYTQRTMCDARALKAEMHRVKAQGYALNLEEFEEGVSSIAVPLHTAAGEVNAGINFSMPSVRLSREKVPTFLKKLLQTAKLIEADLHC
jgi:DNA-binding IclR family transcriptional regulator